MYKLADVPRIWKAMLKVHIVHFPPIENHHNEKFNVSGLLNENSDMKKNY